MKYSLFIGRWQPWHKGHRWLIDQRLNEGKNVCVAIRDVEPNENQPYTPQEVYENLHIELQDLIHDGRVRIIIIPDIESVNYGRGVGYEIIEHIPPGDIHDISATKIRQNLRDEGKL
jgi:cytidyltransferase-like protein